MYSPTNASSMAMAQRISVDVAVNTYTFNVKYSLIDFPGFDPLSQM